MKNFGVYFRAKHCGPKFPQILKFKSNGGKFWPKCSKIRVKKSFFSLAMLPQCCTPPNPSRVLVSCGCVEHTPQPNWGVAFFTKRGCGVEIRGQNVCFFYHFFPSNYVRRSFPPPACAEMPTRRFVYHTPPKSGVGFFLPIRGVSRWGHHPCTPPLPPVWWKVMTKSKNKINRSFWDQCSKNDNNVFRCCYEMRNEIMKWQF